MKLLMMAFTLKSINSANFTMDSINVELSCYKNLHVQYDENEYIFVRSHYLFNCFNVI
jgi:hypothetical protein